MRKSLESLQTAEPPCADEFYVGYLPVPSGYARFAKRAAICLLVGAAGLGATVIHRHANPGSGIWGDDRLQTFEGVLDEHPYLLLRVSDRGSMRTMLLVEEGKFGARARAAGLDGQAVRVKGTLLHRDGRNMIEIADGDDAVQPWKDAPTDRTARLRRPAGQELGARILRGEIIDPKCYLGAMKPGEGKAHKSCATLCISGGIPPMLVTRDQGGVADYYLLADAAGNAVGDEILPFVADPVELRGHIERWGDLQILRLEPGSIQRL